MTPEDLVIDPGEYSSFPLETSLVVIRKGMGRLFVLNETARLIWNATLEGKGFDDISKLLVGSYGIEELRARKDVKTTFAEWSKEGLIGETLKPSAVKAPLVVSRTDDSPDHLDSPHSIRRYTMCGVTFRLVYNTHFLEQITHPRFGSLETPDADPAITLELSGSAGDYRLSVDGVETGVASESHLLEALTLGEIIAKLYPETDWLLSLHAAAVSDGRWLVAMPAIWGGGKSTLTTALLNSGFHYFSDDIVPITTAGDGVAFPIDICLKEGSWRVARRYTPHIDKAPRYQRSDGVNLLYYPPVGRTPETVFPPTPVKCFVFPRYTKEAPTVVRPLSSIETLSYLTYSESKVIPEPDTVERFIAWIARTPAYLLTFNDLDDAVRIVQDIIKQ